MTLYAILGLVALIASVVGVIWFVGRRAGSTAEREKTVERTAEIQHGQLEDSTLPRDSGSVVDRLRKHQF